MIVHHDCLVSASKRLDEQLNAILNHLGGLLLQAIDEDPGTQVIHRNIRAGCLVDVEEAFSRAASALYPEIEDLASDLIDELAELPTGLLFGEYQTGIGSSFRLELLELPGNSIFITVPSNRLDDDLPMRALAAIAKPASPLDVSLLLPELFSTNSEQLFWSLPTVLSNQRPDLISTETLRAFLLRVERDAWPEYLFDPPLPKKPRTQREYVEAYLRHACV